VSGYSSTPITLTGHRLGKRGVPFTTYGRAKRFSQEDGPWHNPLAADQHPDEENG
jgi:hypothetical protein